MRFLGWLANIAGVLWTLLVLAILGYYLTLAHDLLLDPARGGLSMAGEITDAAWFYSSLAQASASIVGVTGAVFAARITDHVRDARRIYDETARQIVERVSALRTAADSLTNEEKLVAGRTTLEERQTLAQVAELYRTLKGPVLPQKLRACIGELGRHLRQLQSPWASELVSLHVGGLRDLDRQISDFRLEVYPRSLWAIWALLAWLTIFGVIWPLAALPGLPGTLVLSKGLVLPLFSLGAIGFVLYLLYELVQLWRLGRRFEWR